MVGLTSVLSDIPTTIKALDAWYEADNTPRTRLGLSQAGHECKRFLWYCHNGFVGDQPEGRILRLFQLGNILEDQTIMDLKLAGVYHHSCQKEVKFSQDDVVLTGHIDGIVEGLIEAPVTPHLFEHKTCSRKKYDELIRKGSYHAWNEVYFWQVQFYMLGLKLKKAAVFVYCKDDSRLYLERIKLERDATFKKLRSVFEAINSSIEPDRACPRVDFYKAKWCSHYKTCFNLHKPKAWGTGYVGPF